MVAGTPVNNYYYYYHYYYQGCLHKKHNYGNDSTSVVLGNNSQITPVGILKACGNAEGLTRILPVKCVMTRNNLTPMSQIEEMVVSRPKIQI